MAKRSKKPGFYCKGESKDTVCFVPTDCIRPGAIMELDRDAYIQQNLHIKNMRSNKWGIGGHLFPLSPLVTVAQREVTRCLIERSGLAPEMESGVDI